MSITYPCVVLVALSSVAMAAYVPETLTFTDAYELKIQNDGVTSTAGTDVADYFIDGGATAGDAAHAYDFLRFENLFGSGLGQIPAGATILAADLTIWTSVRSNAQTNGPFGVAPLAAPFAASNVYGDYSGPGTGFDGG